MPVNTVLEFSRDLLLPNESLVRLPSSPSPFNPSRIVESYRSLFIVAISFLVVVFLSLPESYTELVELSHLPAAHTPNSNPLKFQHLVPCDEEFGRDVFLCTSK